jgi:hypothetical protein
MVSKEKRATLARIGAVQLIISFFIAIALLSYHKKGNSAAKNTAVTVDQIKNIELRRVTGDAAEAVKEVTVAGSLWEKQPAIVYIVRRPGCPLWYVTLLCSAVMRNICSITSVISSSCMYHHFSLASGLITSAACCAS